MRLLEYEAKQLLAEVGIAIPEGYIARSLEYVSGDTVVCKAQVPINSRKSRGGIISTNNPDRHVEELLKKTIEGLPVAEVLVEQKVDSIEEYYVGVSFDTQSRSPVILLSKEGGSGVERRQVHRISLQYTRALSLDQAKELTQRVGMDGALAEVLVKLYSCFVRFDCKMIDINPLAEKENGEFVALDCVAILDDDAKWRQKEIFPNRLGWRKPTALEQAAREIDEQDHRGVAGKSFLELDGSVAILASGGGASLTAIDALISYEAKPANYAEYSGNPPAEKVEKLARITLSKEGLTGCFIVGGVANFTRIDETFKGIIRALEDIRPAYPIVVRRGGPGDKEAFALMRDAAKRLSLDVHLFDDSTPITESAKIMAELSKKYGEKTYGDHNR